MCKILHLCPEFSFLSVRFENSCNIPHGIKHLFLTFQFSFCLSLGEALKKLMVLGFDFSLGISPNRLSQQMMWPWIYLQRAFSLCLLSHVYGLVLRSSRTPFPVDPRHSRGLTDRRSVNLPRHPF